MDNVLKDSRFAYIAKDPKFRHVPKAERKVKIDNRFKDMFKDKKFTVKYSIDKRGKSLNRTNTEDFRKYYDLSSSEDENTSISSMKQKVKKKKKIKNAKTQANEQNKKETVKEAESNSVRDISSEESKDDESDESSSNKSECSDDNKDVQEEISELDLEKNNKELHEKRKNENLTSEIKEKLRDLGMDYARGEGILLSDSSSEEESSEASDTEEEIEHNWSNLDKKAETTDEITHRLAICNMDWDRIRAADLMILLNSFLPSSGLIHSIMIYPSEFGQQRIKEEEINGPMELRSKHVNNKYENKDEIENEIKDEIEDDDEEGPAYHMEKLRQYQLNRLKYYYAVAEFDSAETANKIYTECDGIEYESTAIKLDLRFIPDDMTFDQEPKETCTEIPEPMKYQPRQFTTKALQQVKVELTWDETNLERQEFTQKLNSGKLQDIDENDLQTYLASGSEDDSDIEEKKNVCETNEINSTSEINSDPIKKYKSLLKAIEEEEETKKNKDVELEFTWQIGKEKPKKLVKEEIKNKEKLTPFEQYLEKRKMKKKAKKEEKKSLKNESQKSDSEDSLPSDVDINDEYFVEELKNSKSSTRKKGKKSEADDMDSSNEREENQRKAELELLLMDQNEDDKNHFNMKQIEENATMSKSKRKRLNKKRNVQEEVKEDDFKVDVKDPRFNALYTSHHFNIDPTDPHYRKTKGTEALINEKLKRRAETNVENAKRSKKPKTDGKLSTELQVLVKSVKQKTQNIMQPIK